MNTSRHNKLTLDLRDVVKVYNIIIRNLIFHDFRTLRIRTYLINKALRFGRLKSCYRVQSHKVVKRTI